VNKEIFEKELDEYCKMRKKAREFVEKTDLEILSTVLRMHGDRSQ